MAFADRLKKLDAHRLQQTVRATVQANGRLTFSVEATKAAMLSVHGDRRNSLTQLSNGLINHYRCPNAWAAAKVETG